MKLSNIQTLISRLHARLGDFWWYSILLFAALRVGDLINAVVGLWLVPKYVSPEELGAVMPLMQFSAFVGFPMAVLVTVFSRYLAKFKAEGDEGKVKSALHWFIGTAIAFNVAACLLSILMMPHFFERIRVAKGSLGLLVIVSGLIGPLSLVFSRALQGLKKFKTITFINLLSAPIRLGVMLVTLPIRALSGYMVGQIAAPLFTIVTAWIALRRNVRKTVKAVPFWQGQRTEVLRYFALVFLSLAVGSISAFIMPTIIRQRLPEVESAAYYMITRFAELATFASATLTFVMFPLASEAHAKGKDPLKLFIQTTAGSLGFGVLISIVMYFFGSFIFDLIPTCRPYAAFVPDMALLAFSMTIGAACGNFTDYEFACGRFRFLWWNLPLTVVQTAFAVCFTGYEFFRDRLPDSIVDWMGSLNIATLRNFIWMLIITTLIRIAAILLHLTFRKLRARSSRSANSDRAIDVSNQAASLSMSYFSENPLSCNWFDIVNPAIIASLPAVCIGHPIVMLNDRHAIKAAFKAFGIVTNKSDGLRVSFPSASAGKMLYQSGTDIRPVVSSFKTLFEESIRAWDEKEVPMPGHKFHFNVSCYSNYICKYRLDSCEYFIRFTIRKIGQDSSVHASTISEVAIYQKTEGILSDSHLENPEDGHRMPFIDHKISYYLSACQGDPTPKSA